MDDKHDILHRRSMLCGKINNVLCFFCQQNLVVKLQCVVTVVIIMAVFYGIGTIRLLRIFVLPGAWDSDVHLIFQDVLILCLHRLYVDFFH